MKRTLLLATSIIATSAVLAGSGCVSHQHTEQQGEEKPGSTGIKPEPTPCGSTTDTSFSEEDTDIMIKGCLIAYRYAPDIIIHRTDYYTDASGTRWIGFAVSPVPAGIVDPGYGVLKEAEEGKWAMVSLATAGWAVPTDVKKAFKLAPYYTPEAGPADQRTD